MCKRCNGQGWYYFYESSKLANLRNETKYKIADKELRKTMELTLRTTELCDSVKLKMIKQRQKAMAAWLRTKSTAKKEDVGINGESKQTEGQ